MRDEIYIKCGDSVLDTDKGTKIGFSYQSDWLMNGNGGKYRTFDLSVPATDRNNKAFAYHEEPNMSGLRQSIAATVMTGGVVLNGVLYVTQWNGDRYSLLFIYGKISKALSVVPPWVFNLDITVVDKMRPTSSGRIPDFGFYQYGNGQFSGEVCPPMSMFPCSNLGYLIDTIAGYYGYTVNYPDPLLGRRYQADAYGLILPTMYVYNEYGVTINGSPIGTGGFSEVVTGGTLADAGLSKVSRWYRRGIFGNRVMVWTYEAMRPVKVTFAGGQNVVVASGEGYDIKNSWSGVDGCELEMQTGEWFTVVSPADWTRWFGVEKWNSGILNPAGYTSVIAAAFTCKEMSGLPANGSVINLSDNIPNMTMREYLDAYCMLICAYWSLDEDTKEITITPFDALLQNLTQWMDLDGEKVTNIGSVKRYIEGWAQKNTIRCKTAGYVEESQRFYRHYPVENDYLDNEREVGVVPFNDGGWEFNQYEQKAVFIDDVQRQANGEIKYNGMLTIVYENAGHDGALHVQTVNDEGLGASYGEFTRHTNTVEVSVLLPLYRFLQLSDEKAVTFRGATYVVESAQWGDGVAKLTLLSLYN